MGSERRSEHRRPVSLLVQYRKKGEENWQAEYADNVSKSGIYVRCVEPYEIGTALQLQLVPRGAVRLFEATGVVRRVDETGMGISFENVQDESIDLLVRTVLTADEQIELTEDLMALEFDDQD